MRIFPTTRRARFRAFFVAGVPALLLLLMYFLMISMPGESYEGDLPPRTAGEIESSAQLEATVRGLTVEIGERNLPNYNNLLATEAYLTSQLGSFGYQVSRQPFLVESREVANLAVELAGSSAAAEIIVVGAHYDSVDGCRGADDNASGVAVVVELARLMRTYTPARTIRFVFFVNEEPPYFQTGSMGSLVYARAAADRGDNIVAMLSVETIGYYDSEPGSQDYPFPLNFFYPDTGDFVAFVGNLESRALVRRVVARFRSQTQFPSEGAAVFASIPGIGWSDHWSFWQQGFPALMVTDTAPFRNPHYHQPTDTVATLDFGAMARITHGLVDVIEDLERMDF